MTHPKHSQLQNPRQVKNLQRLLGVLVDQRLLGQMKPPVQHLKDVEQVPLRYLIRRTLLPLLGYADQLPPLDQKMTRHPPPGGAEPVAQQRMRIRPQLPDGGARPNQTQRSNNEHTSSATEADYN